MFKLNLKIAWRNLWKNKAYTAINIIGLAAGLAGFMIILLYINKETGYDKWNAKLERTYQVGTKEVENGAESRGAKVRGIFEKVVNEQFPEVEAITIGGYENRTGNLRYEKGAKVSKNKVIYASVDSNFYNVYPLTAVNGSFEDFNATPNAVAISLSKAKLFFGEEDPINKVLIKNNGVTYKEEQLIVKAVWDDKKQPSVFGFEMLLRFERNIYGEELPRRSFSTLFRLHDKADAPKVLARLNDAFIIAEAKLFANNSNVDFKPTLAQALAILKTKEGITQQKLIIEPIPQLNLKSAVSTDAKQTTIYILTALASFLILISCVNYTNLALVLAQGRAKEVGVKKVLGCFRRDLAVQFLAETGLQCGISYLLALILVELLLPTVNGIIDSDLVLFSAINATKVISQAFLLMLGVIFIAGLYPSIILSGFIPAKVLKGNFSTSKSIGNFRRVLVVFQFTIAISLVISFLVIYAQLNFMKNKDLGLQPKLLMDLRIGSLDRRRLNPQQFETIRQRLLAINGVEAVTRSTDMPIQDSGFEETLTNGNKTLKMEAKYNDINYLSVVGAKILKGRDFSAKLMATDTLQSIILNEAAFQKLGLTDINTQINLDRNGEPQKYNVIGVVKDIQIMGFDSPISPTVYLADNYANNWRSNIILRISAKNMSNTVADIQKTWLAIEPGADPYYNFVDDLFAKMNKSYEALEKLIFSFGMLTLVISLLGLLGFAAYSAKIRIKEIAVRRILGASTISLLKLLNKDLVKLVIAANIIADILAYIYMSKWFQEFVYRIEMPIVPFIIANIVSIALTIFIVSLQSVNTVNINPARALKYE